MTCKTLGVGLVSAWLCSAVSGALAQGAPVDQYKQMGSIAAVAETCYGSKQIPERLNPLVKQAVKANPALEPTMKALVAAYNDAYHYAIGARRIWNGTQQSYSQQPVNCANAEDVDLLKRMEHVVLSNMK